MSRTALHEAARAAIPPFHVMDVWAAAGERQRTHGDLINLSAGQPSTPAPRPVRLAAADALERDVLGYTVALGLPELRAGVAAHYGHTYGLPVTADDVVLTTGSSGGFLLAFLAAFDVGDRVAMARPGYPCYRNILTALGCEVVELPCGPETRHQPTVAMLEDLDGIDGLIVASPANPTGTVLPPDELAALAAHCERAGIQLISDEIYHGISYPGAPATSCAWTTSREAVVVNSFSKYFSMTGWRLGWLLVPERLRRAVDRLTGNFTICPPALAQHAAVAAFTPEGYAEARRARGPVRGQPRAAARRPGPRSASTGSPPPTAPSTSTPTSPTSPTTRWPGPTGCSPRPGSRSRRASTSTRSTGTAGCGSRSRAPPTTSAARWTGSACPVDHPAAA